MAKSQKSKKDQKQVSSKETNEQTEEQVQVEFEEGEAQELVINLVRGAYNRARKQKNYSQRKGRTDLAERYEGEEQKYGAILASIEEDEGDIPVEADTSFSEKVTDLEKREEELNKKEKFLKTKYEELRQREEAVSAKEGTPKTSEEEGADEKTSEKAEKPRKIEATDAAKKLAKEEGINLSEVEPTGADGDITIDSVREHMDKNKSE